MAMQPQERVRRMRAPKKSISQERASEPDQTFFDPALRKAREARERSEQARAEAEG